MYLNELRYFLLTVYILKQILIKIYEITIQVLFLFFGFFVQSTALFGDVLHQSSPTFPAFRTGPGGEGGAGREGMGKHM